jgi:hypothetical protein
MRRSSSVGAELVGVDATKCITGTQSVKSLRGTEPSKGLKAQVS